MISNSDPAFGEVHNEVEVHNKVQGTMSAITEVKHSGLRHWMQRVLKQCAQVQRNFSADSVHDLRTALRRCRSIASGIAEIDSEPAWHEMRRESRKLFRRLGDLRDLHVQSEW